MSIESKHIEFSNNKENEDNIFINNIDLISLEHISNLNWVLNNDNKEEVFDSTLLQRVFARKFTFERGKGMHNGFSKTNNLLLLIIFPSILFLLLIIEIYFILHIHDNILLFLGMFALLLSCIEIILILLKISNDCERFQKLELYTNAINIPRHWAINSWASNRDKKRQNILYKSLELIILSGDDGRYYFTHDFSKNQPINMSLINNFQCVVLILLDKYGGMHKIIGQPSQISQILDMIWKNKNLT